MLIEGKNAVKEALVADLTINKLMIDKNYQLRKDDLTSYAMQKKVKIEYLPKTVLDKITKTGHHQGYIAETVDFIYSSIDDILSCAERKEQPPFLVLLDEIEDPHNLGAIIRTCECAGVHGIIIPKNRACQVNETVIRTSAGATANMPICRVTNLKEAIDELKEKGLFIFATDSKGENIFKQKLQMPIAIVIGSEGKGVRPSLKSYCDGVIALNLKGKVNSLNASVACGIIVFEILRQREDK